MSLINNTALSMTGIYKNFGPVRVLTDVNFSVGRGEVMALLGANGAGKSTLMKILGGIVSRSAGNIKLFGNDVNAVSPKDALEKGIGIIHQELSVIPQLTVLDNFFLGRERTRFGVLSRREMITYFEEICRDMCFEIPHHVKVKDLGIAERQMIEIMKTVSYKANIIVMDEPTSSLGDKEKRNLFEIIKKLKSDGKTIIYITHMLDEVFEVCDSATVMLDGRIVDTSPVSALTPHKIAEMMAGSALSEKQAERLSFARYNEQPVLSVRDLRRDNHFSPASFDLFAGEVFGIAGLVGAGRSELVRVLFGADKPSYGEIFIDGKASDIRCPADAVKYGIGLIPEDRKNQGLVLKHSISNNATLLSLDRLKHFGMLSGAKEKDYTLRAKEKLSIKLDSVFAQVKNLSGGNQQKVVVSKWLEKDLRVLIFDEPTKGIDINAKEDIFSSVFSFAEQGVAVIFISSDPDEVLRVSDRVAVMHAGKVKKILRNENLSVTDVMREILV